MQRKAISALFGVTIGILLGAIVLIVVSNIGIDIASLLKLEKNDDNYFDSLLKAVKDAKDGEQEIIYYISSEHFLAGFGKNDDEINNVKKPVLQCSKDSCICKCDQKDGKITYDGCFNAECEVFKSIDDIQGITLLGDSMKGSENGKLMIKGKIELPLRIQREGTTLVITTPQQK